MTKIKRMFDLDNALKNAYRVDSGITLPVYYQADSTLLSILAKDISLI